MFHQFITHRYNFFTENLSLCLMSLKVFRIFASWEKQKELKENKIQFSFSITFHFRKFQFFHLLEAKNLSFHPQNSRSQVSSSFRNNKIYFHQAKKRENFILFVIV